MIVSLSLILSIAAIIMSTTVAISVSSPADFHVHLRQGDLSELVTPHVRKGGFHLAYVMVIFHPQIPRPNALKYLS
jgi:dihydroorotase